MPIRKLCFANSSVVQAEERSFTITLKLIALVVVIILWPSFNQFTAYVDLASLTALLTGNLLAEEAFLHTFLCLLSCISTTIGLRIFGEKIVVNQFIRSILNVLIRCCRLGF